FQLLCEETNPSIRNIMSAEVDQLAPLLHNPASPHYLNRPSTINAFDSFSPAAQKLARSRSYNLKTPPVHVRPHTSSGTNYETSYQRDFYLKNHQEENLIDVPPSQRYPIGCPYQLGDPIGIGQYQDQYNDKGYCRSPPIRTGTSSGTRANNPHPLTEFMVWRYPKMSGDNPYNQDDPDSDQQEQIKQALKNQLTSTYRSDYLGK
ncbi:unnamed protein product, partial [Didymodactylos carnosus]